MWIVTSEIDIVEHVDGNSRGLCSSVRIFLCVLVTVSHLSPVLSHTLVYLLSLNTVHMIVVTNSVFLESQVYKISGEV